MPRERIGDAYVRIHADGRGMGDEIADDFKGFDPVIKGAGKHHGKTYWEAFDEESKKTGKVNLISFAGEINKSFGRFDAGSDFVQRFEVALKQLREKVSDEHGPEIGDRLAQGIHDAMQRGAIRTRDDFLATISDLRPSIARITEQIDAEQQRSLDKMLREQESRLKELERAEADSSAEIVRIRQAEAASIIASVRERGVELEKLHKEEHARVGQSEKDFDTLRESIEKYSRGITEAGVTHDSLLIRMRKLHAEMRNVGTNTSETDREFRNFSRTLQTVVPRISRTRVGLFGVADGMGRLFGRGSRNDFLNFIGSVIRGISRLTVSIVTGVAEFTTKFVQGIGEMISGLRTFSQTLSEQGLKAALIGLVDGFAFVGTTAATAGVNLLVLAGAIAAVGAVAAIAVPLIGGLVGILTALVSTVAFGAAAALPALVAGLLPLAAGIGVVTAAFLGLDDAQKKALKADLKPLTDAFRGLADAAADVLFQDVGKWAKQLKPLVEDLEPGIVGVAKAIRTTLGDAIDSAAESPKMDHFIDRMNTFLPNAVRKVGDIFTNVFEGIGGVILAMLPTINRFLRWLGDITQEFSNWANSKGGRQELREFFRDAGDSAAALGEFLKQAGKFLGELLQQTRADGDKMFRQMADAVQRMVEWLSSPEGHAAIADWMDFAHELFDALGRVVVVVANIIDTLDSPGSRAALIWIIDQIGIWIAALDQVFQWLGKVDDIIRSIADAVGSIPTLNIPGLDVIPDLFGKGETAGHQFGTTMTADLLAASGVTEDFTANIDGLKASLDDVTGAATEATRALALTMLQESGMLAVGRDLGFTARELVGAFSGQKGAMDGLRLSGKQLRGLTDDQRESYEKLMTSLGFTTQELRKQRRETQLATQTGRSYKGMLDDLPDEVKTIFRQEGVKPNIREIAGLIESYNDLAGPNLTGRQIRTIISATGLKPTKAVIDRVRAWMEELDDKEANPAVGLDKALFDRLMRDVEDDLKDTDKKKTEPSAHLDLQPFLNDKGKLMGDLAALNKQSTNPAAHLDLQPFYNDRGLLIASLNNIPDAHVNIVTHRIDGGGHGAGEGGADLTGDVQSRTTSGGKNITTGPITIVEAADGRATAREFLNHLAAASY